MDQTGYIILTIALVVVLLVIFVVSFVAYVKTPAPKGCEKSYGPNCDNCDQASCQFYHYAEMRMQKKKEEEEASKEETPSDRKE